MLNEYKFFSGDFDHIYINYTTCLTEGIIHISERRPEQWLKVIDFGLSPERINSLSDKEKNELVFETTFQCLYKLYEADTEKINLITKGKKEICEYGQKIEIQYMTKETTTYKILLSYQINPEGKNTSCVNIVFEDKKAICRIRRKY